MCRWAESARDSKNGGNPLLSLAACRGLNESGEEVKRAILELPREGTTRKKGHLFRTVSQSGGKVSLTRLKYQNARGGVQ